MKKFMTIPLFAMLALPAAWADGNVGSGSMIMEEESVYEEGYGDDLEDDIATERMEERRTTMEDDSHKEINYKDRTRTDRERHAINTGSDASDDQ